jgi:shikimate dehydrogenase
MPTASTAVYAVIGCPVEHSLSPAMHAAAIAHHGLDAVYLAFRVEPQGLPHAIAGMRALGIRGLNVTIPHKRGVARLCDRLLPSAEAAGGVNTIDHRDGELLGASTDGEGFLRSLAEARIDPGGRRVLLAGAGGSARAIAVALAPHVRSLHIAARRPDARAALTAVSLHYGAADASHGDLSEGAVAEALASTDIVVNTTPLGMWPAVTGCLPLPEEGLRPELTVVDIVPNPMRTTLLARAEAAGCRTLGGVGMLVHQGAVAFEMWTGLTAPVEAMRIACESALHATA